MAYSKENLKRVKETLASRRTEAITAFDSAKIEICAKIPALATIERELSLTGSKIMSAALSHELTDEALAEIRKENERLRSLKSTLLEENGYPYNALDIKYTCPKCCDTGYVGIDMCACMKRELVLAGFESSGLGALLKTQSFHNFSLDYYTDKDRETAKKNLKMLYYYAENFRAPGDISWILLGATGLGKTHLSTAVAKRVIERGFDVVYETAQGLITAFEAKRFGGDHESTAENRFYDCDLLIIDDLGVEITNQFTVACLYNVLNSRINAKKSTIISTNLTQSELRERYADRITSRLFGEFQPLLFAGKDIRAQKVSTKL